MGGSTLQAAIAGQRCAPGHIIWPAALWFVFALWPVMVGATPDEQQIESVSVLVRIQGTADLDPEYFERELKLRLPQRTDVRILDGDVPADKDAALVDIRTDIMDEGTWEVSVEISREHAAPLSRTIELEPEADPVLILAQMLAELLLSDPDYLISRAASLPEFPDPEDPWEEPDDEPEDEPEPEPESGLKPWIGWLELTGGGWYAGKQGYGQGGLELYGGAETPFGLLFGIGIGYGFPVTFQRQGQKLDLHSLPWGAVIGWRWEVYKKLDLAPHAFVGDCMYVVIFRPKSGSSTTTPDHNLAGGVGASMRWRFLDPWYIKTGLQVSVMSEQRHLLNREEAFTTGAWRLGGSGGIGATF